MIPVVIWIIIVIIIVNVSTKKAGNRNRTNSQVNRPMNNMGPIPGRNVYQQQNRQVNNQNRQVINQNRMTTQTVNRPVNSAPYYNNSNQGQIVQPKRNFEFNGNCAARYEEWQEVPNGCSVVTCEYCNAQNLVPLSRRKNYQCYFCWKNL